MSAAYIILIGYLYWLATKTDRADRVMIPYRNGHRLGDYRVAELKSWINRRVGLTNHVHLPRSSGVLIRSTPGIHTFGMAFPIDIVIMKKDGSVEQIYRQVPPNQKLRFRGKRSVLELGPGIAEHWQLAVGSHLSFCHE